MDLRQLAALLAIEDHGSFSAAARALFTVQSNVSAHVARLERELGVTLVDRSTGQLTEEGHVVTRRARRVHGELEAIRSDLASRGEQVTGEARIGVIGTTARWLVPQLLRAVRDQHPHVRSIIVEASTSSLLPQLRAGRLDLAVVNLPLHEPAVETEPLFAESLILLVPSRHALADRTEVALAEVAEHELLLPAPATALRDDLDAEARRQGITLRAAAEIDGVRLLTSLAFEGFAPAIVPATAVPGWLKGEFRRIDVPDVPRRVVGLARPGGTLLAAPARAVIEVLLAVVAARGARQRGVTVLVPPRVVRHASEDEGP